MKPTEQDQKNKPVLMTLDMFFNAPLQEGVDLEKQLKPLNYYQILQRDKSFFRNFDEDAFKQHLKVLRFFYHPDKNSKDPTEQKKATMVFQKIQDACECMLDAERRNAYLENNFDCKSSSLSGHQATGVNSRDFLSELFKQTVGENLAMLDELEMRLQTFLNPNSPIIPGDSFKKICEDLASIWDTHFELGEAIHSRKKELFYAIHAAAKTGDDFYNIGQILERMYPAQRIALGNGTIYSLYESNQDGARLKHPLCMRFVAGSALSGLLPPYEQSVPWAIKCLIYLETTVIPALQDEEILEELTSGIDRAKKRIIGLGPDEAIPNDEDPNFHSVVKKTIEYLVEKKIEVYGNKFRLDSDFFNAAATPEEVLIDAPRDISEPQVNVFSDETATQEGKTITSVMDSSVRLQQELLDDVAKGKQEEADAILESSEDKQILLQSAGKFTDYSGRTFYCTAYEYAYWAKDTHMQRMLERHMDDETKAFMLEKIEAQEQVGLAYQQHGISYQNAHYDMSFILKDLTPEELNHLKAVIGQSNEKLNTTTVENYRTISFTADEYEQLKKDLAQKKAWGFMPVCSAHFQLLCYIAYPVFFIASLFITSPAEKLSTKLTFDFHSLITALDSYVTNFDKWTYRQKKEALMKISMAQCDVPAHVAHEYCRPDRSFDPLPTFTEEALPRTLTFYNNESWFPLTLSSSGLGFGQAAALRGRCDLAGAWPNGWGAAAGCQEQLSDLAAVRHLDEVRIADLTQSRNNLSDAESELRNLRKI